MINRSDQSIDNRSFLSHSVIRPQTSFSQDWGCPTRAHVEKYKTIIDFFINFSKSYKNIVNFINFLLPEQNCFSTLCLLLRIF